MKPYNTAGFLDSEIIDEKAYRNAFGLVVQINTEAIRISMLCEPSNNWGFTAAFACKCNDNKFDYKDRINYIEISLYNEEKDEKENISSLFRVNVSEIKQITLEELFNDKFYQLGHFQFELVDYQSIPESAVFVVDTYMESGAIFSNQTQTIYFKN